MSFWRHLLCKEKRSESVVLIDINATSVAGAYVRYVENEPPVLLYSRRVPIEIRNDEPHEDALLRTIPLLGNELIREGAPILMRATGSGTADTILVSIDTPWQETKVRTENFERDCQFVFTKDMVISALQKTSAETTDKLLADESVIGTILNGYETRCPYGKKVRRASVVVLTSFVDKRIAEGISSTIHGLFHTKHNLLIAGSSLRYQAMRLAFPHERDALILDATGPLVSISLIRRGLFITLAEIPSAPGSGSQPWIDKVMHEFAAIAEQYPLPRIIFLLARESESAALQKVLDAGNLGKLWLSDNPPKIISVLASHIASAIRQTTPEPQDLQILLMARYYSVKGKCGE